MSTVKATAVHQIILDGKTYEPGMVFDCPVADFARALKRGAVREPTDNDIALEMLASGKVVKSAKARKPRKPRARKAKPEAAEGSASDVGDML